MKKHKGVFFMKHRVDRDMVTIDTYSNSLLLYPTVSLPTPKTHGLATT